jgi:hypothetical protein
VAPGLGRGSGRVAAGSRSGFAAARAPGGQPPPPNAAPSTTFPSLATVSRATGYARRPAQGIFVNGMDKAATAR